MSRNVIDSECASGTPQIAVSLADISARHRVTRLLQSQGCEFLDLSSEELARWDYRIAWQALVYDLCPWNESALETARHILDVIVGPILLYVPHAPGVGHVLEAWARDPRVMIKLQFDDQREAARLQGELYRLRLRIPCEQVAAIVEAGLPDMSARVSCFVRTALRDIGAAGRSRPTTASAIAEYMTVSVRTLERTLHAEGLPNPKELINWLTLLYATLAAELAGLSLFGVARSRGWYPSDLYRLRHRLMSRCDASGLLADDSCPGNFDQTLLRFFKRCGIPRQRAQEVLTRAS